MTKSQLRYTPKATEHVERREEVSLDSGVATSVLLATERVTSVQTLLSLRQLELQVLLGQIRSHFEENGRYVVHEVDPVAMVVRRTPRPEVVTESAPAREPTGSAEELGASGTNGSAPREGR